MNHPLLRLALCAAWLSSAGLDARAMDLSQRSVSLSKQFFVYSEDRGLRLAIVDAAEESKHGVLSLLGIGRDGWKYPIVITAKPASATGPAPVPSSVQLFETDGGFKVEFDLCVTADPADVQFQQQLVRSILLELAYRDTHAIKSGCAYNEPPMWLIEGIVALLQNRESGGDIDVFKTLISANRIPSLRAFLEESASGLDSTSRAIYCACAMSLVHMLIDLPEGHACLASYLHNLAGTSHDTMTDLLKHFPALGGSEQSLEKWWSLNMARFSAADRYAGLSNEETEQQTAALLQFQLVADKKGAMKVFSIEQYKDYLKIPASRQALIQMSNGFLALQTRANPLFRPVVFEYQKIVLDLARGKTGGVDARLAKVAKYRRSLQTRMNDIADYLNWFEATQITTRSDAFNGYLKTASELSAAPPRRRDPISQYIDSLDAEFQ